MLTETDWLSWLWAIAGASFIGGFLLWVTSSWWKDFSSRRTDRGADDGFDQPPVPRPQAFGVDLMVLGLIILVITLITALFLPR